MSLWYCFDRCSGERFEVHGHDADTIRQGVEAYIREGIDADTGSVDYDVTATAVDGSEYSFSGTVQPVAAEDDDEDGVLAFWRRTGQPAFPVESVSSVEVVTPEEYADEYGGTPNIGTSDSAWHVVSSDSDGIDEALGLCGDLSDIHLLCDAMHVSAAIHQHLGLPLTAWDEDCLWKKGQLDSHGAEDADYYFRTIGKVYGADAEAAARRQYAKE